MSFRIYAIATAVAIAASGTTGAQDAASSESLEAGDSSNASTAGTGATRTAAADALDSVTVTARRRAENVQTVPIPISTIGAASLEKAGMNIFKTP